MCTVMTRLLLLFGIFALLWQDGYSTQYDNHTLIRFLTLDKAQLAATLRFHDPEGEVEILKTSRGINDTLDILVPPNRLQYVHDYANQNGLEVDVKNKHYGRSFEDLPDERTPRRRVLRNFNVFEYNSYNKIQEYLDQLANQYPDLLKLQTLGNSYEGRRMRLARISAHPDANNPVIFVDAGIHSREWVAPAMAMYMIHRLVSDPFARKPNGELTGIDWYILPVSNPDGYEYTRYSKDNRMWRKTRSKNGHCYGVDGNRNYGFKWAVSGVSHDPCNKETFAGPRPFSEPETKMIKRVMLDNSDIIKLYVSLHSYGQYLVYPWGYTADLLPSTWQKLDSMARDVSASVQRAGGKPFNVMSAGKWYPAAGGSDDYAFGVGKIPYSYTMELTDGFEFLFPEPLLHTVLPQFYEGFRTFAANIRDEYGRRRQKRNTSDRLDD